MSAYTRWLPAQLMLATFLAASCGGSNNNKVGTTSPPAPKGLGQLEIALVDAPTNEASEIWVNITRVTAHSTALGWVSISEIPIKVDLLKLQSSAMELGLTNLPPGTITQIRLFVTADDNYVVVSGKQVPLKVPSGSKSGIKVKGPWEITACDKMSVTLDFDGKKSIYSHPAQQGDEWILRPVIRVKKSEKVSVGCSNDQSDAGCVAPETCGVCEQGSACLPGGFNNVCESGTQCLSGICTNGHCSPGGAGVPCKAKDDCISNNCQNDGTCAPVDNSRSANESCQTDADCLSNSCYQNLCQPGVQGAPCKIAADCQSQICTGDYCAEIPATVQ